MVSPTQFRNRRSHYSCLTPGSFHISSIGCHGISREQGGRHPAVAPDREPSRDTASDNAPELATILGEVSPRLQFRDRLLCAYQRSSSSPLSVAPVLLMLRA